MGDSEETGPSTYSPTTTGSDPTSDDDFIQCGLLLMGKGHRDRSSEIDPSEKKRRPEMRSRESDSSLWVFLSNSPNQVSF